MLSIIDSLRATRGIAAAKEFICNDKTLNRMEQMYPGLIAHSILASESLYKHVFMAKDAYLSRPKFSFPDHSRMFLSLFLVVCLIFSALVSVRQYERESIVKALESEIGQAWLWIISLMCKEEAHPDDRYEVYRSVAELSLGSAPSTRDFSLALYQTLAKISRYAMRTNEDMAAFFLNGRLLHICEVFLRNHKEELVRRSL